MALNDDIIDAYRDQLGKEPTAEELSAAQKAIAGGKSLTQFEQDLNRSLAGQQYDTQAIESYFETSNLGWNTGGPAQQSLAGDNYWLHLERVEPDFVQSGEMNLYVTGRPFAQSQDKITGPYPFGPNTNKIDLREQRRELRLKFVSNVAGGNYQLGYLILNADVGDVRPY